MRMSPRKLPHHSVATDTHPTVETTSSNELPLFSVRDQGPQRDNSMFPRRLIAQTVTQVNSVIRTCL